MSIVKRLLFNTFGKQPICAKEKCIEQSISRYNYCHKHCPKCIESDCQNNVNSLKEYCSKHKCKDMECKYQKLHMFPYCRQCLCTADHCLKPKITNQKHMETGKCKRCSGTCNIYKCTKPIADNVTYCSRHTCHMENCNLKCSLGYYDYHYCDIHKCENIYCKRSATSDIDYCGKCKCAVIECNHSITFCSRFCCHHVCCEPLCDNATIFDNLFCRLHICYYCKTNGIDIKSLSACFKCIKNLKKKKNDDYKVTKNKS
jgi:hypothetical protein